MKLKVGRTVIAQSTVQPNGHYTISNQSNAKADLVYYGIGVNDDVYLATVLPHQSDTVKLTSELPASILRKYGAINCPKCKQKDKVLPIAGRAGVIIQTSDGQRQPYDKRHYYPDSDVSYWLDPHWYCVRDTIKF